MTVAGDLLWHRLRENSGHKAQRCNPGTSCPGTAPLLADTGLSVYVAYCIRDGGGKMPSSYFWHLTDIHWDPNYNTKDHNCLRVGSSGPRGKYGEHSCDSPWSLVQSAAEAMANKQRDDIEFILWTGDSLTNSRNINKMAALTNLTHLLSQVFTSHFVFPVLGHDDPEVSVTQENPYQNLSELWKLWLPSEALATFVKGGYYTIERRQRKLRLVALNTNLCTGSVPELDPAGQWAWLEKVLAKSKLRGETVYLAGHIAPGVDERVGSPPKPSMSSYHNTKFLSLIRKYADIITGQFFGHLHSDTFRLVYSELGFPISRLFLAPSVTPRRSSAGLNNPAIRLYKIEIDTGQVLDYSQFYLDLPAANAAPTAAPTADPDENVDASDVEWVVLYNLTDYYGFRHGSPEEFHELAESFTVPEGLTLFMRYFTQYTL
ncbi:Acid sphingomyelinase-like phosphodiesterase 3b [Homalodisca vitripennis]|nr:Acid sphingomyelinase-like phosphodiesterase 3b [Homalodisca vitripennis]